MNNPMTSIDILRGLSAKKKDPVYVLNQSDKTSEDKIRGQLFFTVRDATGSVQIIVPDTHIPFDLTEFASTGTLQAASSLRRLVMAGTLVVLSADQALRLLASAEAQAEMRRISAPGKLKRADDADMAQFATDHAKKLMAEVVGVPATYAEQTMEKYRSGEVNLDQLIVIVSALRPTIDHATVTRILAQENVPAQIRTLLAQPIDVPSAPRTAAVAAKAKPVSVATRNNVVVRRK